MRSRGLDKLTQRAAKGSAESAGQRVSWVREVGKWTYAGRAARAGRHLAIAARAPEGSTLQRWHEGRANGQLERIDRVEDCGSTHYQLACKSCGVVAEHVHDRTCSSWRYCVECRGRRARQYRERIGEAREQWLARKRAYERERFLTVTVPHCGIAGDVRTLLKSWERFTRGVRRWLRKRGTPQLAYVRALEITPSDGGHAHMHAWVGSPFLPHAVLRVLWGRALSSDVVPVRPIAEVLAELPDERSRGELLRVAGWRGKRACDGSCYLRSSTRCKRRHWVPWPVLDIRAAYGDVADELVKYLIKDVDQGELVDPLTAANLIEATEGVRVVAASRGYWVVVAVQCCEHCNEPALFLVLAVDAESVEHARGPPRLRSYSGNNSAEVAAESPNLMSSREVAP